MTEGYEIRGLRDEVAFVVLSCDRYSDLWEPCFRRLRRYWPGLPFDVYLVANKKGFDSYGVQTLFAGEDLDWSSTVRRALTQLSHPYVFFWFEDAFLDGPMDNHGMYRYLRWAIDNDADYVRLRSIPKPAEKVSDNIGRLAERIPYRNTCFASIWKREVFLNLLRDGESAAEFEMQGTKRSDLYPRFYGVYCCPFNYLHGVVRGVWLWSALRKLVSTNDVPSVERPVMTSRQEVIWRINELKGSLVTKLPPGWAEFLFALKRAVKGPSR